MRRDDHRGAEPVERGEQAHQAVGHVGIDIAGRLVGDEQFGRLITARAIATRCCSPPESVGGRALARSASPTHASISRTGPSTSSSRAPATRSGKRDIVEGRQVPDQAEVLEHHADAAAEGRQSVALRLAQFLPEQVDAAARRALREVEQPEQRGLARAGRAGEEIEAAAAKLEVEVAQHFGARAVTQADAIEFRNG